MLIEKKIKLKKKTKFRRNQRFKNWRFLQKFWRIISPTSEYEDIIIKKHGIIDYMFIDTIFYKIILINRSSEFFIIYRNTQN